MQGAKVRYRPLDNCEARIVGGENTAIITVNTRSSPRRQRFSIAHELGHWNLHRGRVLTCRTDDLGTGTTNRPEPERTADVYAADLLMPDYLFKPISATYPKLTFDTVYRIADVFNVSVTAAAIRLVEGGYTPSLLVCHGKRGRKWFARSSGLPEIWFPQDQLDAESFAFDVLFGGQANDRMPRRIGADAWFDRFGADRYEVSEQTMRIGDDEILTLLLIIDEGMLEEQDHRYRQSGWR